MKYSKLRPTSLETFEFLGFQGAPHYGAQSSANG
jgi:hypothetical protein